MGEHLVLAGSSALLKDAARGCSGWDDFGKRFGALTEKKKGDLFEELVKAYLLLDPEYATKLSVE